MNNGIRKNNLLKIFSAISVVAVLFYSFQDKDYNFLKTKNFEIFYSLYNELDMFYVDTINPDKSIKNAIDGMLARLDPYTVYYSEDDNEELEMMTKGTYGGIGSVIVKNGDYIAISEPYVDNPAYNVGLKAGDLILSIDGENLKGKSVSYVSDKLRGDAGTRFRMQVQRPGVKKNIEFELERKVIQLPVVPYYGIVDDSIGYIKVSSFSGEPYPLFKEAFLKLSKNGIKSIIIDLRGNGGGLLDQAVKIANIFIPKGCEIVSMKGKTSYSCQSYKTTDNPIDTVIPVAVMVDSQSASASEILAGAMQDLDRGVIVGERTFGKGLVQNIRPLPYKSSLKMTVAKYYTPSGRCIQALDYSHRNNDGSVTRIPDSLTNEFRTSRGRIVWDGGGIKPDVEFESEKFSNNLLFYLITENKIFNYATDYCLKHEKISDPKSFTITDEEYDEFKKEVMTSDFKYDRQSVSILKSLKDVAEFEGYTESAKAEFDALEKKLSHNLDYDLEHFKADIVNFINLEIVKRYYYQRGGIIKGLEFDEELEKTVNILNDRTRYENLLNVTDLTDKEIK